MSNSFDEPRDRRPPARRPPPKGRDPRHDAPRHDIPYGEDEPYEDPRGYDPRYGERTVDPQRGYPGEPPRYDEPYIDPRTGDPRTGPATFDFQPSPLRTGPLAQVSPAAVDPGHGVPRDDHAAPRPAQRHSRQIPPGPPAPEDDFDTGRARPAAATLRPPPKPDIGQDLYAPSRTQAPSREPTNAPIVPAGSVTGRSLTLVIAIMCFLACLTAGAVYLMNQSAAAWLRDIASEVTVQVEARERSDVDKTVRDVSAFLQRQPGIRNVKPMSIADNAELLEPWLGQSEALKSLPVPRLIALEVDRGAPPDFIQLRAQLTEKFKGVSIDDHRHWQHQIRTVTRSFALGGLAILMLVGAATTAIIVSATRSALASNREIVEVLHFVGATDRFIAREFEKHFLRLGIRAGIVGAASAMAVFVGLPFVMELLGGGTVTIAEIRRLIGTGALDISGYVLLAVVVFVIAALCMLTSRIGVYRILNSQH